MIWKASGKETGGNLLAVVFEYPQHLPDVNAA